MGIDILNYLKKSSEETRQAYQESINLANQIKARRSHPYRIFREAPTLFRVRNISDTSVFEKGYPVGRYRTRQCAENCIAEILERDREERHVADLTIPELAERAGFQYDGDVFDLGEES